jgi:hypothetical protein
VAEPTRPTARRRGAKPKISDEDLLAAILADLEASMFEGERYRKVWARVQQGIRVEELKKTSHVHSWRPQGAPRDQTVNFRNQDHRLIDSHGYKS